jgi:aromatic-L-amino-acid/L-tryptophan decarboxylase
MKEQEKLMLGDIPGDEFRKFGHEMVDRIADYYDGIERFPVLSQAEPGWLAGELPQSGPSPARTLAR